MRSSIFVVILAVGVFLTAAGVYAATTYEPGSRGWDVSWPQCGSRLPRGGSFAVVGLNGGLAFTANPCFEQQLIWAEKLPQGASLYVNLGNPGTLSAFWPSSPSWPQCDDPASVHRTDCAAEYGRRAAEYAHTRVEGTAGLAAAEYFWWLDVELANSWEGTEEANAAAIQGYIDFLRSRGINAIGIYSTPYQWSSIAGASSPGLPVWIAGARNSKTAPRLCRTGFAGGEVLLVQYYAKGFDANYVCVKQ